MHRQQSNSLLNNGSLPPLHPAPGTTAPAPLTPPPSPTDEIRIIQGRSASSRNIFHAGFRYSKDSKPLVDGQQSWRCVKRDDHFPGRIYTINDTFYQMPILHAELASTTPGKSWTFPCIYILLTNKDTPIYPEALQALADHCPHLFPQVIMVDFEQAFRSALSSTFPGAEIDRCYFHYCHYLEKDAELQK